LKDDADVVAGHLGKGFFDLAHLPAFADEVDSFSKALLAEGVKEALPEVGSVESGVAFEVPTMGWGERPRPSRLQAEESDEMAVVADGNE